MGVSFSVDEHQSVLMQIKTYAPNMSSSEKKIADYICSNINQAVESNISELSELSGVSDATVVRFCKHLGYTGFYHMKLQLSHDIGHQQRNDQAYLNEFNSLQKKLIYMSDRIKAINDHLDIKLVKLFAEAINNCTGVHLIGRGQSRAIAEDLLLRLAERGIRTLPCSEHMVELSNLLTAQSEEILLCISKSGETKRVLEAAEVARAQQMTVLAITGVEKSPLHSLASYTLSYPVNSADDKDSSLYLMVLMDAIMTYVRDKRKNDRCFESLMSESRI